MYPFVIFNFQIMTFTSSEFEKTIENILTIFSCTKKIFITSTALNNAGTEKKVTSERKVISIKSLACKAAEFGHVLDNIAIELSYECTISI